MLVVNQQSWTHTMETVIQQMPENDEALHKHWEFSCEVWYILCTPPYHESNSLGQESLGNAACNLSVFNTYYVVSVLCASHCMRNTH